MSRLSDDADILIELKKMLRLHAPGIFTVVFATADDDLNLVEGSTQRLITQAANVLDIEVVEVGGSHIELKKAAPPSFGRVKRG